MGSTLRRNRSFLHSQFHIIHGFISMHFCMSLAKPRELSFSTADFKGTALAEAHQQQCPSCFLPAACTLSSLHKHTNFTGLTLLLWLQGGLFSCSKLSQEHPACRKLCTLSLLPAIITHLKLCSDYPGKACGSKEQSGD